MLKERILTWLMIPSIIVVALLSLKSCSLQSQLDKADQKLDQLRGQKALLQGNVNSLTDDLKTAQKESERWRKEAQLNADLLEKRDAERAELVQQSIADHKQVEQVIHDGDEQTKAFAIEHLPADIAGLLKRTSHCANSNNVEDPICNPTGATGFQLPDPGVHRKYQF